MGTTTRTALALLVAMVAGCDLEKIEHGDEDGDFPQRMAEAYCAALFACDPARTCASPGGLSYDSETACVAGERELLAQVRDAARSAGLTYDSECVDATIARYTAAGCDNELRLERRDPSVFEVCPPYHGDIPEGENPCFEVVGSALSECGSGLVCNEDGGQCVSGASPHCECEEGFACEPTAAQSDVCMPLLAEGAVCHDVETGMLGVCGPDGYCSFRFEGDVFVEGVCVTRSPLGAPCSSPDDCSSLACGGGVCIPASPWLCEDSAAPRRWR